jgi:two-component system, NarL family, response regulator NreC
MAVSPSPLTSKACSVVIVSHEPIFRHGLRRIIERYGLVAVAEAATVGELYRELQDWNPGMVIINTQTLSAEQIDEVSRLLSPDSTQVGMLLLALYEDPARARQMLAAGSRACVHYAADAEELGSAVSAILAGGYYLDYRLGVNALNHGTLESRNKLTSIESTILALIAEGFTNRQIAERLYLSLRTVESHRAGLKRKLDLYDRSELTRFVREHRLAGQTGASW